MGVKTFQEEVIERLATIEADTKHIAKGLEKSQETIAKHSERITVTEQSTKSAHHRIDGIFFAAGSMGAIFGTVVNLAMSLWSKLGGKG